MNTAFLLLGAAFTLWSVDPYGESPYLNDKPPAGGVVTNSLFCAAAKGEIETISFSVQPERDLAKVDFVPSDLTGPGGAKIPASAADFALVKVWYRAGGRWETSWCGSTGDPQLINDLVIHDDDLVRVVESDDPAKRTVIIRIDYPDGPAYVDVRKHGAGHEFNHGIHPIRDAKKFVPFDLRKGRFQQYWFTWRIPLDAKPGLYRGSLDVKENGRPLDRIPVEVDVYPFELPMARTHYDTKKPFISAWMGTPSLAGELQRGKDLAAAERRVRGVYRSLAEHNCHCPSGPGEFSRDSTDDFAVRSLIMMRQEGMALRLLINGSSARNDTNAFSKVLDVQKAVYMKYLGHADCYFCSFDECDTGTNRHFYPGWSLLNRYGFDTWTDDGDVYDIGWSVSMNDVPASARHSVAWNWHKAGAKAVTYAGPFTGPLCPDIWRRTKGLRYYYGDFDGHHEYCFYCGKNPWDDFYGYSAPYSQFVIVYPTYDGLIASLAWEGVREGLDDIRYLSLLKLRCEAALASRDQNVRDLGLKHLVWMESQDPELVMDLAKFRREVALRTVELIRVVGQEPPDRPPLPPPALPPLTAEPQPERDQMIDFAKKLAQRSRYDLAIPLWEQVRSDMSRPIAERVEATQAEAGLLSQIVRRREAVRILDETLKMPDLKSFARAKLLLQRVRTLMTPATWGEEFTTQQLDEAAVAIADALSRAGASQGERYGAVTKLVDAYLSMNESQKALDFIDARMKDVKFSELEKGGLYVRNAKAYIQQGNMDKAAQAYRIAHRYGAANDRSSLQQEGWVAEQRKDWKTAVTCYSLEAKTYNSEEGVQKGWCVSRMNRALAKQQAEERKNRDFSFDDTDDGSALDLEE